jgi:hypothetical protein
MSKGLAWGGDLLIVGDIADFSVGVGLTFASFAKYNLVKSPIFKLVFGLKMCYFA